MFSAKTTRSSSSQARPADFAGWTNAELKMREEGGGQTMKRTVWKDLSLPSDQTVSLQACLHSLLFRSAGNWIFLCFLLKDFQEFPVITILIFLYLFYIITSVKDNSRVFSSSVIVWVWWWSEWYRYYSPEMPQWVLCYNEAPMNIHMTRQPDNWYSHCCSGQWVLTGQSQVMVHNFSTNIKGSWDVSSIPRRRVMRELSPWQLVMLLMMMMMRKAWRPQSELAPALMLHFTPMSWSCFCLTQPRSVMFKYWLGLAWTLQDLV